MAKNAAAKQDTLGEEQVDGPPQFSDKVKEKARRWFSKGKDLRERRDYDYAIECYLSGLEFWPEAVEDGHMPLRSLAIQRQQAGGKKPGMMGGLKKSMTGKDTKKCLLNAEHLLSKDPGNAGYLDGLLKNANRTDLSETLKWITPLVFESMRKEKKTNIGRFKSFRQVLVEAGLRAGGRGDSLLAAWFYERAVNAIDYLVARNPSDMALKDEQRDLAGKLTIARGKYGDADSFRESLQDGDKQKLLHDAERAKQGEQTLGALISAARKEYEEYPAVTGKINAYVDALLKPERKKEELEAIAVLMKANEELSNYSFKQRADDVRIRQLRRQTRRWRQKAEAAGGDEEKQQFRLAQLEEREVELDIYRERVAKYATDLRLKFHLGRALFNAQLFDEAIPLLQEATGDPRSRVQCRVLIGRAFFEKSSYAQAAEVLSETLESYELVGDDLSKKMLYWVGRAHEEDGKVDDALATYGKLLRQDYNYADGDARRRHEKLKQTQ